MAHYRRSLPPGIVAAGSAVDTRVMSAAVLTKVAPAASAERILADLSALVGHEEGVPRQPALDRLEEAIGRDFADRLVAALSDKPDDRR
jgi:hypothetical protein